METELAALASSGAATLVGLMVSDSWSQAKRRLAALLGRGGADRGAEADRELEASRDRLAEARRAGDDRAAAAALREQWRQRLDTLARTEPAAAQELFALLRELDPEPRAAQPGPVHNTVSGGVQHAPVVQGRDFTGTSLTFNAAPPAPPADPGTRRD